MSLTGPFRRHPWITLSVVLLLIAATATGYAAWRTCGFEGCPNPAVLTEYQPEGNSVLLDRHGETFAELQPLEREVVPLEDLPDFVPAAFVAVEDRRFYEHGGVDWVRLGGALRANLRAGGYEEGASTLTMQLTRNLFPERIPPGEESLQRKFLEMRVARAIEDRFSKQEILELYLNHIYFGHGARGIEAASQYYFAHPASELTLPKAALLAALPKAPALYDPREDAEEARERRNLVLELMAEQGRLPAERTREAEEAPLGVTDQPPPRRNEGTKAAPWFAAAVRRELDDRFGGDLAGPVRVHTTLDLEIQARAEEALVRRLQEVEGGELGPVPGRGEDGPLQGAVVLMDATEGDVYAWVGGRDYGESQFDRVVNARRQPGSAFKPFVLTAALVAGQPLSRLLEDRPLTVELDDGDTWSPANFEDRYSGQVTVREALVHSKNVAMVRLLQEVGTGRVVQAARRLGIEPPVPHNLSIALGAVEVSPLEIAAAYTPFATLGDAVEPRLVLRVEREDGTVLWRTEPQRQRVLDPSVAWLVTDVLSDVVHRGTGRRALAAGVRGAVAGKTGTTNDNTDTWFVGYTPRWVGTVWIGFDTPRSLGGRATGGRVAAPVWGRVVGAAQEQDPPQQWRRPGGIVEEQVDPATGHPVAPDCEPAGGETRPELFLFGTVPEPRCPIRPEDRFGRIAGLDEDLGMVEPPEGFPERELERRLEERRQEERRERRERILEGRDPERDLEGEGPPEGILERETTRRQAQERQARERQLLEQQQDPERQTPEQRQAAARERLERERAARERAERERTERERAARQERETRPDVDGPAPEGEDGTRQRQAAEEPAGRQPAAEPEPQPSPQEAPSPTGPGLDGRWELQTRITESDVARYEGLTLRFRLGLSQDGGRLTGSGEKIAEGGESLPAGRRTPIRVQGSVDGREVRLRFSEQGGERASGGSLWLRLSEDGSSMTGRFRSDAANSRGTARLDRLR